LLFFFAQVWIDADVVLAFVFAEVEDFECAICQVLGLAFALHADKPFARGVDGELAEIADDPLAAQLLGHGCVVPEPQKKSATMSFSLEEAQMMRFSRASGF
jgi:hypothetical protein